MTSAPPALTRQHLHHAYQAGLTPVDVMTAIHSRLDALGDAGILIHRPRLAELVEQALALGPFDAARFPLWGLPFVIKDNIDLAGVPTTAACPGFAYVPAVSATCVSRLMEAGAIPVGKANLDQFATGLVGVRSPYPIPRNPFDATRVPGGSSSGSAVAVAQGLASFSLGTDTAGSGRIPAAFNNLVGLKPSLGAVSTRGVVPACRTLDCVSIFALDVADALAVFDVIAAPDASDPYSRDHGQSKTPISRIAIPRESDLQFFGDDRMAAAWTATVDEVVGKVPSVTTLDMTPFFAVAKLLYEGPWVAERRAAVGALMDERPDALHAVTRAILAGADRYSAVDTFNAFYRLAELKRICMQALDGIDALIVPTAPIFPTLAELEADPIGPNSRLGTYTNFVNLIDLAAIAIPGPFRSDGLPAGMTLIGRAGTDRALAALAARLFPGVGGLSAIQSAAA
jgi:allophanate hydrolase